MAKDKLPASMPPPLYDHDPDTVLEAERDIRSRLGDHPLDFAALLAVSNIYRAANAVRRSMERDVLSPAGLSWGGFTILFVLWVWGDRETGQLADDCGVAKGTLTGMLTTLERAGLVERSAHSHDGRKVMVNLREDGEDLIESVFPVFNEHEARFTAQLEVTEQHELARLLRLITATATGMDLVESDTGP
ncbi:MAG TPA: MarR family winged helix-turn-helix transcriptional regulator [Acidimicrobiia bacterium]|nr:MarR family winged helix-turn-helix transcriptional regulator [Acidimicrobiia bacterium]